MNENPELQSAIECVLKAAEANRGEDFSPELRDALNGLVQYLSSDRDEIVSAVSKVLPDARSASGAGALSIWLGAMVEHNSVDPELTIRPLLATFLKWSRTLEIPEDDGETEFPSPDEDTLFGMKAMGQSVVAHLSHCPHLRSSVAQQGEVLEELERTECVSIGAMWVLTLLRQRSGELIVLHAEKRKGVRVTYKNIGNCFHLFTLLQGALAGIMPGARSAAPDVIALAQGATNGEGSDTAWWHYGQGNVPRPELHAMVFGETSPDTIARIDGEQVLLLWSPVLGHRGWDAGFFSPILRASLPSVHVERELSQEEVNRWWTRLGLPETRKPKWKFW